jgi:ferrochelatase
MQIRTLEGIVEGKLLNLPSISFITQIHTQVSKINEGDLYICQDPNNIEEAIKNGAFAILFENNNVDISLDNEIAWIKVDDLEYASLKLARFLLSTKDIKSYFCDDITTELLSTIITNKKNIKVLSQNIFCDFRVLNNLSDEDVLVCSNMRYLTSVYPNIENITKNIDINTINNLTIHSLFMCSFSYQSYFFDHIRLPYMYIKQFISLIIFISNNKTLNTNIDISQLKHIVSFCPIFIDNHYDVVEFGKSNRFIIANDNKNLIDEHIDFINTKYEYGKFKIIEKYNNDLDLLNQIKKDKFNAMYIFGKTKNELEVILKNAQQEQLALFS